MSLRASINKLCDNLLSNPQLLLDAGFSSIFVNNIQDGYVFISNSHIDQAIEKAIAKRHDIHLYNCIHEEDGIKLNLLVKKYWLMQARLTVIVRLTEISINSQKQNLKVLVALDEINGENSASNALLKLVLAIERRKPFLFQMIQKKITQNPLTRDSKVSRKHSEISLNLSNLKPLQNLVPLLNKTPLEVMLILGVEDVSLDIQHVSGGIRVKTEIHLGE